MLVKEENDKSLFKLDCWETSPKKKNLHKFFMHV
jgi:hypothetical protein